ncbi:trypsin-like serine protease [Staphylococcus pseudintermedius]|nr:trypsin-like serine protease [Staphylococcus pseudintermedius]MCE5650262.1 trypsin-like serine protease [Staphylococcus pseudintermedius]PCF66105.1 hypothetical protein B5C02_09585 [Staphylococcus pseudintermedius]
MPSTEVSTQSKVNFNNTDNYGDFFPHVESVIGTDERKKVTSFTSSPIKENVAIKVEWKNSEGNYEGYVASGVMVSKDTVLTAAHVVYDEGRKKIAERITVYSGLYGNIIRGSAKGIKTYVLKGYTSTLDSKYDLWNSFYFDSKKGKSDAYVNKPVIAKYIYTLGNGGQYYSLYSIKSDKWLGYVNVNATK